MIDTQLHIIDPAHPVAPGGYHPRPDEAGTASALIAAMAEAGIMAGVLVQPSAYGTDNALVLKAMAAHPDRFRAIVMCDDPARAASIPGVVGVRLNLTDYAPHLAVAGSLAKAALGEGLLVQVQATPDALERLLSDCPDGPVVIDHMGRPRDEGEAARVARLAARPQTVLKVSGGFRIPGAWPDPPDWIVRLASAFDERVVWGSDWPFLNTPSRPTLSEAVRWAGRVTDLSAADTCARRLFGFDG